MHTRMTSAVQSVWSEKSISLLFPGPRGGSCNFTSSVKNDDKATELVFCIGYTCSVINTNY